MVVIGTDPDLAVLYEGEYILATDSVKTSNNNKPFIVVYELCDIFSK